MDNKHTCDSCKKEFEKTKMYIFGALLYCFQCSMRTLKGIDTTDNCSSINR